MNPNGVADFDRNREDGLELLVRQYPVARYHARREVHSFERRADNQSTSHAKAEEGPSRSKCVILFGRRVLQTVNGGCELVR
jgi:hypothetical protein